MNFKIVTKKQVKYIYLTPLAILRGLEEDLIYLK